MRFAVEGGESMEESRCQNLFQEHLSKGIRMIKIKAKGIATR